MNKFFLASSQKCWRVVEEGGQISKFSPGKFSECYLCYSKGSDFVRSSFWKLSRRESLFTFQNYEAVNQVEWYIQISKMYTSRWLVDVLLIASFYIQRDQQECLLNEFHGPCKNVVKNVLGNLIHVSLKHLQLD